MPPPTYIRKHHIHRSVIANTAVFNHTHTLHINSKDANAGTARHIENIDTVHVREDTTHDIAYIDMEWSEQDGKFNLP